MGKVFSRNREYYDGADHCIIDMHLGPFQLNQRMFSAINSSTSCLFLKKRPLLSDIQLFGREAQSNGWVLHRKNATCCGWHVDGRRTHPVVFMLGTTCHPCTVGLSRGAAAPKIFLGSCLWDLVLRSKWGLNFIATNNGYTLWL
jgi:hypothetical protein